MRNYGLIRGLSQRHQVSLLSFCEPDQIDDVGQLTSNIADPLRALCARVETVPMPPPRSLVRRGLDTLTRRLPDMALRLVSPAYAKRLAAWLARESFDVVHVEGIEMTPYLDLLRGKACPSTAERGHRQGEPKKGCAIGQRAPLVIFDDHNCEYMLQRSYALIDARSPRRWAGALYSLIQWQKLRRYEANVCRRAHHVLAVSQTDAEALQQLAPNLSVTVIPNGIDTDQYQTSPTDHELSTRASHLPTLVFTGKMDFRPNVDAVSWFAEAIWPHIKTEVPGACFFAVGQRPHPRLDPLQRDPSITLTGWVEEVPPYIARATVYVVPLRMGSGTRLKLLQAMAMGKAIVSTKMGAEGLTDATSDIPSDGAVGVNTAVGQAAHGRELILVDDNEPVAFADAVVDLLRDPNRRAELGTAARQFVRTYYDWRCIIPRLEAIYVRG